MRRLPKADEVSGHAALAICESLLLALIDLKVIAEQDSHDLLQDAAAAHRQAGAHSTRPQVHDAVVAVIERMLAGKNGTYAASPAA